MRLLLIEDNPVDMRVVTQILCRARGHSFEVTQAENLAQGLALLREQQFEVLLLDLELPDATGFESLERIRASTELSIPIVVLTGLDHEGIGFEAVRRGAQDFLAKADLEPQMLVRTLRYAVERHQITKALASSEHRLKILFEYAPDAYYLHDLQGNFVDGNKTAEQMSGYERGELIGKSFLQLDLLNGEDLQKASAALARNAQGLPNEPEEYTLRRKDGTHVSVEIRTFPIRVEDKVLVLGMARDISSRKLVDLQRSVFSLLGKQLSAARTPRDAGEAIFEAAGQLLGWDACTCDLYSAEQDKFIHVLSKDTFDNERVVCKDPPLTDRPSQLSRRAIEQGGFLLLKENPQAMAPEGKPFGNTSRPSASLLFAPIRKGAKAIGVLSVQSYKPNAYDEQSLRTLQALADHCAGAMDRILTQQQLTDLLAQSPAVIYKLRIWQGKLFPLWFSSYIQQLLGFSLAEVRVPDWWFHQLHPDDKPEVIKKVRQVLALGHVTAEYRMRHKNGEYRWIRDELRLVCDERGEPEQVVGSWVDISERKSLEEQLRQVQKMEAIGRLAGGVAHDFNNLLVVMRGNAELLLLDSETFSAQTQECLKQITGAAERAANLTRQLLAFSRKQVMQTQPLVLNDVLGNLTKMLNRIIGEQIDLQCHYAAGLPFVQADPGMMEQVVLNLAVNARDAMPQGGQLHIATDRVTITTDYVRANPESCPGDFVCLTVRDSGTGIAPEHLPRIFEPFFTTKEAGKGTGLGLATVYGIVKQHQGWVEVSTAMGAGATFKIFLPVTRSPEPVLAAPKPVTPPQGGTESILLVEDDAPVRTTTRRMLESFGYEVIEASSAREGLGIWENESARIALLLTDIVMPEGFSGGELAERLRQRRPTLKVILMSGYSPDAGVTDPGFMRKNNFRFIQKPCSSRTLLETVRQCLDQN